ncbi:ribonuclease H-like domain-containing protein [Tanacetum coccineum]
MLDIHNLLVPSFRMAKDTFVQSSILPVTLRLIGDDNLTESHDYLLLFPYGEDRTLHKAGRLFHTFCVDAYTAVLDHELDWYKRNQNTIRSELYNGLHDRVTKEETNAEFLGRKFVLPSTFIGVSTIKLPILKKGEYDIWAMKMEHYLAHTDYPIWEVIQNKNGPVSITTDIQGQIKVLPPRTAKEIIARERERKAMTTLLMALPEDHLAKFHKMTDAKEI